MNLRNVVVYTPQLISKVNFKDNPTSNEVSSLSHETNVDFLFLAQLAALSSNQQCGGWNPLIDNTLYYIVLLYIVLYNLNMFSLKILIDGTVMWHSLYTFSNVENQFQFKSILDCNSMLSYNS